MASEVILAMPKRPLERLNLPGIANELDKVQDIPLLKVFFVDRSAMVGGRSAAEPLRRRSADARNSLLEERRQDARRHHDLHRSAGAAFLGRLSDRRDQPGIDRRDGHADDPGGTMNSCREQQTAPIWILEAEQRSDRAPRHQPAALAAVRPVRAGLRAQRLHHGAPAGVRDSRLGQGSVRGGGPRLEAARQIRGRWRTLFRRSPSTAGRTNVHICGDAYSDYQGFIEGALRSAGRVLSYLRSGNSHERVQPLDDPRSNGAFGRVTFRAPVASCGTRS